MSNQQNPQVQAAIARLNANNARLRAPNVGTNHGAQPAGVTAANMAGCAPFPQFNNAGYANAVNRSGFTGIGQMQVVPELAPAMPDGLGALETAFLRQYLARLGVVSDVIQPGVAAIIQIQPKFSVNLYVGGLRTLNGPGEFFINSIQVSGGIDMMLGESLDAGFFSTDEAYVPLILGCVSTSTPLSIGVTRGAAPLLAAAFSVMLVGTTDRTFLQCGNEGLLPYLIAHFAASVGRGGIV